MPFDDDDDLFNEEFDLVDDDDYDDDEDDAGEEEASEEASDDASEDGDASKDDAPKKEVEAEKPERKPARKKRPSRGRRSKAAASNGVADSPTEKAAADGGVDGTADGGAEAEASGEADKEKTGEEESSDDLDEFGRPKAEANYVVHVYEHKAFKRTIDRPFTPEDAEAFTSEFNRTGKSYGRLAVSGKNDAKPKKSVD